MFTDGPVLSLALTISAYWGTVLLLVAYKRLHHGGRAGVKPRNRYERRLWRIVLPAVGPWILLPILAATTQLPLLGLPAWAHELPLAYGVRAAAAGLGVLCYLASVYCWLLMGRSWSMAIVPGEKTELVTRGIYRLVRHPIYGLSVTLMLATVVVLPTLLMAAVACLHIVAMNLKARHEERHLQATFGTSYVEYCQRAGRFWPRWTSTMRRSA